MKYLAKICLTMGFLAVSSTAFAQGVTRVCTGSVNSTTGQNNCQDVSASNPFPVTLDGSLTTPFPVTAYSSASITNPTSTLTLPSTTTQYSANTLICTSGTVATCNTALQSEFFTIPNTAGGAIIPRLRLSTNDNTTTAWNGQTLQVDLWSTYPTFQTTGDRGAFITDFLTGSAAHLGAYTCVMAGTANTAYGDGTYAECTSNAGNATIFKLASGTSVYWTLQAVTGSYGVTGASKVFTLTVEELN